MGLLELHPENFVKIANIQPPTPDLTVEDQIIEEYRDVFEGDLELSKVLSDLKSTPECPQLNLLQDACQLR